MKIVLSILCALLFAPHVQAFDPTTAPSKKPPVIGMTMDHALAYYGEPFHRVVVDGTEQWYYHLKFAEVYGRAFVPFRFDSDDVRMGRITFGRNRKITSFDWSRTVLDRLAAN